jgi:hypothetical protein
LSKDPLQLTIPAIRPWPRQENYQSTADLPQ